MEAIQPSLWDNTAMEAGFQNLVNLHFDLARNHFMEALTADSADTGYIHMGLDACNFWQPKVEALAVKTKEVDPDGLAAGVKVQRVTALLKDYKCYSFKQIRNFGNNLLSFLGKELISLLENGESDSDSDENATASFSESLELLIDLLMGQRALQLTAIKYLDIAYRNKEHHPFICFLRAEVYARTGFKMEAAQQYVHNFFYFPRDVPPHRKLPEFIQKLLGQYGPYWTPVYGAVHQVLPQAKTPENIKACCLEHEQALEANRLFDKAEFLLRNKDLPGAVLIRKQLKQQFPEFSEHYQKYIHQREARPSQLNQLP